MDRGRNAASRCDGRAVVRQRRTRPCRDRRCGRGPDAYVGDVPNLRPVRDPSRAGPERTDRGAVAVRRLGQGDPELGRQRCHRGGGEAGASLLPCDRQTREAHHLVPGERLSRVARVRYVPWVVGGQPGGLRQSRRGHRPHLGYRLGAGREVDPRCRARAGGGVLLRAGHRHRRRHLPRRGVPYEGS